MKKRWSNKAKAIRNLINAAKLRGDTDSIVRLQKNLDEELELCGDE